MLPGRGLNELSDKVRLLSGISEARGKDSAILFWYKSVKNKGLWDYKQRARGLADFGNFNYGVTAASLGIPEAVLLWGGGYAQSSAGTSRPEWGSPWNPFVRGNDDDPADQAWIKTGIDYYNNRLSGGGH